MKSLQKDLVLDFATKLTELLMQGPEVTTKIKKFNSVLLLDESQKKNLEVALVEHFVSSKARELQDVLKQPSPDMLKCSTLLKEWKKYCDVLSFLYKGSDLRGVVTKMLVETNLIKSFFETHLTTTRY